MMTFIYLSSGTWSLMGIERKYAEWQLKSKEVTLQTKVL